ncbi:hypothetical protein T09_5249 [Trichinella sp. T9]|nr:hypothetical protein T09_5249 [Trichinella sp. T9]
MLTSQVVICPNIYIMDIPKRQSFIGRKAVVRSILIFLLVSSCWGYRVFNPSSPAILCTAWQKWKYQP